ncbi:MAG: CPBP family intramembrane metalloprotease [Planctomycetes bacterium]|nr:CPBP family intramembrane metalloprotease [Planctomycetota bacterium]
MDEPDPQSLPAVRQWPHNEVLDPARAIAVACPACAAQWRVHEDMAGFRLRCECGTWIAMPPKVPDPAPPQPLAPLEPAEPPAVLQPDERGLLVVPAARGEVTDQEMPVHLPLAPASVLHGNVRTQQRWTNAAFLELALLMAAFLLPHLLADLLLEGEARALALPFVSMATGVVVVLIAAATSPYAFRGLCGAPPRHFAEATVAAAAAAALAFGWMSVVDVHDEGGAMLRGIRDSLGVPWSLFVIAVCPALFEELAFRGAVQGRLLALLGRYQGLLATGVAFGLCHGVSAALPFHVGLGVYFGWLRERAASLLPGMLAHGLYNGAIVLCS